MTTKDIPIIFSAPMILALLAGRKTQTRRLAMVERKNNFRSDDALVSLSSSWQRVKLGDRMWVRETLVPGSCGFEYDAGGDDEIDLAVLRDDQVEFWNRRIGEDPDNAPRVSPVHMPRWASRLTLIVAATKIERLWDISVADCMAEGVVFETADPPFYYVPGLPHNLTGVGVEERDDLMPHAVQCFRKLWIHLHGRAGWDANPEVVAVSFLPVLANIDALKVAA